MATTHHSCLWSWIQLGENQEEREERHWPQSYGGCARPTWRKHHHACYHLHEYCHCPHTLDWTVQHLVAFLDLCSKKRQMQDSPISSSYGTSYGSYLMWWMLLVRQLSQKTARGGFLIVDVFFYSELLHFYHTRWCSWILWLWGMLSTPFFDQIASSTGINTYNKWFMKCHFVYHYFPHNAL